MPKYIVFYKNNTTDNPKLVECIGSGSIVKSDQRYSVNTLINKVLNKEYYKPNDAIAFLVGFGANLFNIRPLTNIIYL